MTEVFKVWSSLELKGNAIKQMKEFAKVTAFAAEKLTKLNQIFPSLNRKLMTLSNHMSKISVNSDATDESLKSLSTTILSLSRRTENLSRQSRLLADNLRKVGTASLYASSVGARVGTHRGRHAPLHALHTVGLGEAAKVGMGFGASGRFAGAAGVAGFGAAYLGYAGFEQQVEFQRQIGQLEAQGMPRSQIAEASRLALTKSPFGVSNTQMLEAYRDAFMATRDFTDAKKLAVPLAKGLYSLKAKYGRSITPKQAQDLVKFAEMRGGSDYSKQLDAMKIGFQMVATSGGSIQPSQLALFMRRHGAGASVISDIGMLKLEPVMQELKAQTLGFALRTMSRQLIGGSGLSNNQAALLSKVGMMHGIKFSKTGRVMGSKEGALDPVLANLLQTDPVAFAERVRRIAYQHGYKTSEQYNAFLQTAFGALPATAMTLFEKNKVKQERAAALAQHLPGINQQYLQSRGNLSTSTTNLVASWHNLALAIGQFSSPAIQSGMNGIARFLNMLASAINNMNSYFAGFKPGPNYTNLTASESKFYKSVGSRLEHIFGLDSHSEAAQSNTSNVNNQQPQKAAVYFDSRQVGMALLPSFTNMLNASGTMGSTGTFIPGISALPTGVNNIGGV